MTQTDSGSWAFKLQDALSYDAGTEAFDRYSSRFTPQLAARMVSLAGVAAGERVLDVGTGTGIIALQAAEKVGPQGKVVGIDLSEGMLAAAAAKASRAGLSSRVEFRRMDAEALGLEDQSFDGVLSLFALL